MVCERNDQSVEMGKELTVSCENDSIAMKQTFP